MNFAEKNILAIVAAVLYTLLSSQALRAASLTRSDYWPTHGWQAAATGLSMSLIFP